MVHSLTDSVQARTVLAPVAQANERARPNAHAPPLAEGNLNLDRRSRLTGARAAQSHHPPPAWGQGMWANHKSTVAEQALGFFRDL